MGCFKENEITQEGELLSAAVIIKDILLRLQNQKLYDAMESAGGGREMVTTDEVAEVSDYFFDEVREACI